MSKKQYIIPQHKQKLNMFLILVLGFALFLVGMKIITQKSMQNNQSTVTPLKSLKSFRVPLTFKYPAGFPVTAAGAEYEKTYLDNVRLEDVNFSETYIPNATDNSYGYLTAKKIDIKDLQKYLKDMYEVQARRQITIENAKTADTDGYRVSVIPDESHGGYLGAVADWTYYFYKNGLLYQMALTNPAYKNSNPDEIKKIFTDTVLSSMKFE